MARELELRNQRTNEIIAGRVRVADNPWTRLVGLLGKKSLPIGEALLIRPCSSVHTFFMRFRMDAIFVDRESRVLKVQHDMRPFRVAWARKSRFVIELMGGALRDLDIKPGDELSLTPTTNS
jgi:uncharacterized membrane protein (UPF0127 family)